MVSVQGRNNQRGPAAAARDPVDEHRGDAARRVQRRRSHAKRAQASVLAEERGQGQRRGIARPEIVRQQPPLPVVHAGVAVPGAVHAAEAGIHARGEQAADGRAAVRSTRSRGVHRRRHIPPGLVQELGDDARPPRARRRGSRARETSRLRQAPGRCDPPRRAGSPRAHRPASATAPRDCGGGDTPGRRSRPRRPRPPLPHRRARRWPRPGPPRGRRRWSAG